MSGVSYMEHGPDLGAGAALRNDFVRHGGGPPEQALGFFAQLYRSEEQARDKSSTQIKRRPIAFAVSDNSTACRLQSIGDAVSCTRNQWDYLTR